jgi:hypothetical protein
VFDVGCHSISTLAIHARGLFALSAPATPFVSLECLFDRQSLPSRRCLDFDRGALCHIP